MATIEKQVGKNGTTYRITVYAGFDTQGKPLLYASFKVRCSSLPGFFCLLWCHTRRWFPGHSVADALALGIKTGIHGNAVGHAIFAGVLFNRCHY